MPHVTAWPDPEAIPGHPGLVDRAWRLEFHRELPSAEMLAAALADFAARGEARLASAEGKRAVVVIRSPEPETGDPLKAMVITAGVLQAIDAAWKIALLHGRPAQGALLLRRT